MGSDDHYPDEGPVRTVSVEGFWIEPRPVTNREFAKFVDSTGYVTMAEVPPDPALYPTARAADLVPGSLVFSTTPGPVSLADFRNWWSWCPGADWKHPTGPDSSLDGLDYHPVVHVAHSDASAYAQWAGRSLPTEAEWEFAARGGLDGAQFTWGDVDTQETAPRANTWQGRFPYENTERDGWTRTNPVGVYEPNGYGLYDMTGNVWEWTDDRYADRSQEPASSCCAPSGAGFINAELGIDPDAPNVEIPQKVIKGGSHLCTTQYCFRYRPAARQPQAIDTSSSHIGFRCVTRAP